MSSSKHKHDTTDLINHSLNELLVNIGELPDHIAPEQERKKRMNQRSFAVAVERMIFNLYILQVIIKAWMMQQHERDQQLSNLKRMHEISIYIKNLHQSYINEIHQTQLDQARILQLLLLQSKVEVTLVLLQHRIDQLTSHITYLKNAIVTTENSLRENQQRYNNLLDTAFTKDEYFQHYKPMRINIPTNNKHYYEITIEDFKLIGNAVISAIRDSDAANIHFDVTQRQNIVRDQADKFMRKFSAANATQLSEIKTVTEKIVDAMNDHLDQIKFNETHAEIKAEKQKLSIELTSYKSALKISEKQLGHCTELKTSVEMLGGDNKQMVLDQTGDIKVCDQTIATSNSLLDEISKKCTAIYDPFMDEDETLTPPKETSTSTYHP